MKKKKKSKLRKSKYGDASILDIQLHALQLMSFMLDGLSTGDTLINWVRKNNPVSMKEKKNFETLRNEKPDLFN